MRIYIISQYLNSAGSGEDRLRQLGQGLVERGHEVTLITGASGSDFELEKKKIGLYRDNGLTMMLLNVPYHGRMKSWQKLLAYVRFGRMVEEQVKNLPGPDLILAVTPPLNTIMPILKLKKDKQVPIVVDVRELWPDAPVQRGALKNRFLINKARQMEEKAYREADRIIAGGSGIAAAVKENLAEKDKVYTIPDGLEQRELVTSYNTVFKDLIEGLKDS